MNPKLNISRRQALQDSLFLGIIVLMSVALYIRGLGFYSDDWVFLQMLNASQDQSIAGLAESLYTGDVVIRQRPIQVVYLSGLYRLFGLAPFGYHAANAIVLVTIPVLFYLIIRELGESRLIALSIPLVYILLPHYSTDRFWIAAFQATLSLALCLLSMFADLRAANSRGGNWFAWKAVVFVAIIGSLLAYEVVLPLLILSPVLSWYVLRSRYGSESKKKLDRRDWIRLLGVNLIALGLAVGFKAFTTVRLNVQMDYLAHLVYVVTGAIRVNFISYGVGLPYVILWILRNALRWDVLALSGIAGVIIMAYIYRVSMMSRERLPDRNHWTHVIVAGLLVFVLGYAVFLVSADVDFRSTSLGNRIAIAAAIGVALCFVGGLGWLVSLFKGERLRAASFSFAVGLVCLCGFLINNTLATFWVTAYQEQQAVFADLRKSVPTMLPESTLILDGICMERGGAYLFTGKRDIGALIMMEYGDKSLWATAITNPAKIEADRLDIFAFRDIDHYPYGSKLLAFHFPTKTLNTLKDANSAREYFAWSNFDPRRDCPPGFAWGWNQKW